jgi:hypothetical protein
MMGQMDGKLHKKWMTRWMNEKLHEKKIRMSFNICNVIISYVHEMLLSSASIDRI